MTQSQKLIRPIEVITDRDKKDTRCYDDLFRHSQEIAYSPQMDLFSDLNALLYWIKTLPFDPDFGGHHDCKCQDGDQRLKHWAVYQNCWENSAHALAGFIRFGVPFGAKALLIDWRTSQLNRHIFPVLKYPEGYLVLDLDEYDYSRAYAMNRAFPGRSNFLYSNEWYNDLLGGVHLVGKTVLGAFGMGGVGDQLEKVEADAGALPSWAITSEKNRPQPTKVGAKTNVKPVIQSTAEKAAQAVENILDSIDKTKLAITTDIAMLQTVVGQLTTVNVIDNKDLRLDLLVQKARESLAKNLETLESLLRKNKASASRAK